MLSIHFLVKSVSNLYLYLKLKLIDRISMLADWMNTFQALYDLDLKSKIENINGKTIEISSDLNPISHRGS